MENRTWDRSNARWWWSSAVAILFLLAVPLACAGPHRTDDLLARPGPFGIHVPVLATSEGAPPPAAADRSSRWPSQDAPRLLWRAGRAPLAGLPAAQAARREAESREALETIRQELDAESPVREDWITLFTSVLADPADPLWRPVARTTGALGLRELAALLAPALAPEVDPGRRHVARLALHRLFGTWFEDADELRPFLAGAGGTATEAFVQRLLAEEERSAERLFEVLALDVSRALGALDAQDPAVRARAAAHVGRAVASGELDPQTAFDALVERLSGELDPRAFEAELSAALAPLEQLGADSQELARLFTIFDQRAAHGWDERLLPIAQALPRLVFDLDGSGEGSYPQAALSLSSAILDAALAADERRGFEDPDAIVAVIGALSTLAERMGETQPDTAQDRGAARDDLLEIVRDLRRAESTRQAAAVALGAFVGPAELVLFEAELARDNVPVGLEHVLLGTLGELLVQAETEGPERAEALSALALVADKAGSLDPDLRRSALVLLADERLEPLMRDLDPQFLLRRLEGEEVAELEQSLLVLLRRFGSEDMFTSLLSLTSFERLAGSQGATAAELDATLALLADGDPARLFEAARRLGTGRAVPRLRRALALVATIDDEGARALGEPENQAIVAWAWALHEQGVPLAESIDPDGRFVERLIDVHLATPDTEEPSLVAAKRHHLLAVLLGQRLSAEAADDPTSAVEAHFARALALSEAPDASNAFGRLVRRDRARFLAAVDRPEDALTDYRALFAADGTAFEVSDLRTASDVALAGASPGAAGLRFAADARFLLVENAAWSSEPQVVRLADLERLHELVLETGEHTYLERFVGLFDDLPTTHAEPEPDPDDEGRPWRGLEQEDSVLAELRALRQRAQTDLARSQGAG